MSDNYEGKNSYIPADLESNVDNNNSGLNYTILYDSAEYFNSNFSEEEYINYSGYYSKSDSNYTSEFAGYLHSLNFTYVGDNFSYVSNSRSVYYHENNSNPSVYSYKTDYTYNSMSGSYSGVMVYDVNDYSIYGLSLNDVYAGDKLLPSIEDSIKYSQYVSYEDFGNGSHFFNLGYSFNISSSEFFDYIIKLTPHPDALNVVIDQISSFNYLITGDGNDFIIMGSGENYLYTGNGNSNISVGDGNNYINLGNGNNNLSVGYHESGESTIGGITVTFADSKQADYSLNNIVVGEGNNNINVAGKVGEGNDIYDNKIIAGNGDNDIISGYKNTEAFEIGNSNNLVQVGDGVNYIETVGRSNSVEAGDGGNIIFSISTEKAHIISGSGADRISAIGSNYIDSGAGNDTIDVSKVITYYSLGNIFNFNSSADDHNVIIGGIGRDILIGGEGHDTFGFDFTRLDSTQNITDEISNFKTGIDKIAIFNLNNTTLNFDNLTINYSADGHTVQVSYTDEAGHNFAVNVSGTNIDHNNGHDLAANDFTFSNEHNILGIG